jgi:hypothetical protein
MGFFDLANPVFDQIDGFLAMLSGATGRLAIWALVGAFITMFLYRLTSRQQAMAELKPQIKEAQKALATFDGELEDVLPLVRRSLGLSARQFALALGPALLASFPLIFMLLWISNRYDLVPPAPGTPITVRAEAPSGSALSWTPGDQAKAVDTNHWQLVWPDQGESLQLNSAQAGLVLELPTAEASQVVHKRQWWNSLMGNPAGYLKDDQPVDAVFLELPWQDYLPFGPNWMRGWEFLFIGLLFSFSIIIKLVFKIH